MKNLFQKAVLGTALIAGLVGCAGKNNSYDVVRNGLILKSGGERVFCNNPFYNNRGLPDYDFADSFKPMLVGLKNSEESGIKESDEFVIINSALVDSATMENGNGKYRVFKSCIKNIEYSKGEA